MKKIVSILLTMILLVVIVTGCAAPAQPTVDTPAADTSDSAAVVDEKPAVDTSEEYVFVTALMNLEYFQQHRQAVEDAAADMGVVGYMAGSNEYDANEMIKVFETLIQKGVAGIITPAHFPDVYKDLFEKAWQAGIPVATVTLGIPDSRQLCFFGTDYVTYGYTMAATLSEAIGGSGKVLVSQNLTGGGQPAWDIVEGINKFAAENPGFNVLEPLQDDSDSAVAARVIGAALQANPDTAGIIGCQSASGVGAVTALREAGMLGQVKVVSIDKDLPTLEAVKAGDIHATVCGKQYTEVYYATKFLYDYNHGNLKLLKNTDYHGLGISPLPSYVDTGAMVVTADNVDAFLP